MTTRADGPKKVFLPEPRRQDPMAGTRNMAKGVAWGQGLLDKMEIIYPLLEMLAKAEREGRNSLPFSTSLSPVSHQCFRCTELDGSQWA